MLETAACVCLTDGSVLVAEEIGSTAGDKYILVLGFELAGDLFELIVRIKFGRGERFSVHIVSRFRRLGCSPAAEEGTPSTGWGRTSRIVFPTCCASLGSEGGTTLSHSSNRALMLL